MVDYLKQLAVSIPGDGPWTGVGGYFVFAVVVALLIAGVIWLLLRFRGKRGPGAGTKDWDKVSTGETDEDFLSPYEEPGLGEDDAAVFGSSEERQLQLESDVQGLGHRLSVTTVLIPLLFFVVLAFVYLDIRQRIGEVADKDDQGEQIRYEELSEQMDAVSKQLQEMGRSLGERLNALEDRVPEIVKRLDGYGREIEEVVATKRAGTAAESRLSERLEKISGELSVVEKNVAEQAAALKEQSEEMDDRIERTAKALSEHEKALQSGMRRIAALSRDVEEVRERLLALAVEDKRLGETKADKHAMETFRGQQERVEKDLTQQIQSLRSDITELAEKFVRSGAGNGTADQGDAPSSEGANIFEQDISR